MKELQHLQSFESPSLAHEGAMLYILGEPREAKQELRRPTDQRKAGAHVEWELTTAMRRTVPATLAGASSPGGGLQLWL